MQHLESRLQKLETASKAIGRKHSDLELAVKLAYLLDLGPAKAPPGVWAKLDAMGLTQGYENERH